MALNRSPGFRGIKLERYHIKMGMGREGVEHFEPGNRILNKPLGDATYQISKL